MGAKIEVIARARVAGPRGVLLCRDVARGYRYLPGGHVEFGEPAAAALAREFREETGLAVDVGPLLLTHEARFTQNGKARHEINLVFHVEHAPFADSVPSLEPKLAFDWVAPDHLGDARVLPECIVPWLRASAQTREIRWLSSGA